MSGGARPRSGPAPDPNALRRDRPSDQASWINLPERVAGDTPNWPLTRASSREKHLWEAEWQRPQAFMWTVLGLQIAVAMYVRTLIAAEKPDAPDSTRTLLLRQQDELGISATGLAKHRWRIASGSVGKIERKPTGTDGASIRGRLKVVQGGG